MTSEKIKVELSDLTSELMLKYGATAVQVFVISECPEGDDLNNVEYISAGEGPKNLRQQVCSAWVSKTVYGGRLN